MSLPMDVSEITPEWLSEALGERWPGVKVERIQLGTVIHGSATKIQLSLNYQVGSAATLPPANMWLKIGLEDSSLYLDELGIYPREGGFYAGIAPKLGPIVPECYYTKSQKSPPQTAMLLEDLTLKKAVFGSATRPFSAAQAEQALISLATFHGKTTADPGIVGGSLPVAMSETIAVLHDCVASADSLFKVPRGYAVPVCLHDSARLAAGLDAYLRMVQEGPRNLVHGDAHVGNTYVLPDGRVGFLDWQTAGVGHWIHDVTYLMSSALDVPVRREHEKALFRSYLTAFERNGGQPPKFDEAWDIYRRGLFYGFIVWLGNTDHTQPPEVNLAGFARAGAAMIDHDVYGALGV